MDHKDKKKLKQEYSRLVGKLERLLKRYNPIDPTDEDSFGDDYDSLVPQLVSMLLRACTPEELFRAIESHRKNYYRPVPPNAELDWKITNAVLKAFLTKEKAIRKSAKPKKPLFRLDLRIDLSQILEYVEEQVRQFIESPQAKDSGAKSVHLIEMGYEYSQAGWVIIYFDSRPGAQCDGSWTLNIDGRNLERSHWPKASAANMRGPVCVVDQDGIERLIPEGSESDMSELIGTMLKQVLLRARDEGIFFRLPLAPKCRIGVEDNCGIFGWPQHDSMDSDSFVNPLPEAT